MPQKKSAHYQRLYRQRLRDLGLVKKEIWILPERSAELHLVEQELRRPRLGREQGQPADENENTTLPRNLYLEVNNMKAQLWTTQDLHEALVASELFRDGRAGLEIINTAEPCLLITMHEYGDLPLYLTVSRQHILVEALLWPITAVKSQDDFNREVLRTHKFFSLSTIGLDRQPDGSENYVMFGALSAASILPNIIFEIETLADNVIRATEAYEDFLLPAEEERL